MSLVMMKYPPVNLRPRSSTGLQLPFRWASHTHSDVETGLEISRRITRVFPSALQPSRYCFMALLLVVPSAGRRSLFTAKHNFPLNRYKLSLCLRTGTKSNLTDRGLLGWLESSLSSFIIFKRDQNLQPIASSPRATR